MSPPSLLDFAMAAFTCPSPLSSPPSNLRTVPPPSPLPPPAALAPRAQWPCETARMRLASPRFTQHVLRILYQDSTENYNESRLSHGPIPTPADNNISDVGNGVQHLIDRRRSVLGASRLRAQCRRVDAGAGHPHELAAGLGPVKLMRLQKFQRPVARAIAAPRPRRRLIRAAQSLWRRRRSQAMPHALGNCRSRESERITCTTARRW